MTRLTSVFYLDCSESSKLDTLISIASWYRYLFFDMEQISQIECWSRQTVVIADTVTGYNRLSSGLLFELSMSVVDQTWSAETGGCGHVGSADVHSLGTAVTGDQVSHAEPDKDQQALRCWAGFRVVAPHTHLCPRSPSTTMSRDNRDTVSAGCVVRGRGDNNTKR